MSLNRFFILNYSFIIVAILYVTYVASLSCLSCDTEEKCRCPTSKICKPEEKVCFSSVVRNRPAPNGGMIYFRGCSIETNICKDLLNISFGKCYQCGSNNCNNHSLKFQ
ncbi:hypothetical protein WA026_007840 [Henosepilachna vigintioctopunctata]|uniref:Uncharacterized protein n=1 Tax=Henosepilachna vigintioctopunctata TaxID=420089 RepID=A0AAW1U823_9CUCU